MKLQFVCWAILVTFQMLSYAHAETLTREELENHWMYKASREMHQQYAKGVENLEMKLNVHQDGLCTIEFKLWCWCGFINSLDDYYQGNNATLNNNNNNSTNHTAQATPKVLIDCRAPAKRPFETRNLTDDSRALASFFIFQEAKYEKGADDSTIYFKGVTQAYTMIVDLYVHQTGLCDIGQEQCWCGFMGDSFGSVDVSKDKIGEYPLYLRNCGPINERKLLRNGCSFKSAKEEEKSDLEWLRARGMNDTDLVYERVELTD